MTRKRNVSFSYGVAGAWDGDPCIEPRMGRNWFLWLPHIHWNGGRPWRNEVVDVSFNWLFFWVGVTVWKPWTKESSANKESNA